MSISLEFMLAIAQAASQRARQAQQQTQQQTQQTQQAQTPGSGCVCLAQQAQAQQPRGQQFGQFTSGGDANRQAPAQPDAPANPQALYGDQAAATPPADAARPQQQVSPLAQAQQQNGLRTNQDLINHCYKNGGNTWEGAARVAQGLGANLNDLVKNRQGAIGAPSSSPAAQTPAQHAQTPAQTPNPPATTTGATRPSGANLQGTAFGNQIGDRAEREARRMNSTGRCALGVNNALVSLGVPGRGHAYQKAEQLANNPRFREVNISASDLSNLPRGAVVVWGKSDAKPYGHVSVALGDGREASDHIARQITRPGAYGTDFGRGPDPQGRRVRVFLPV